MECDECRIDMNPEKDIIITIDDPTDEVNPKMIFCAKCAMWYFVYVGIEVHKRHKTKTKGG